jgi:hypothetical protein
VGALHDQVVLELGDGSEHVKEQTRVAKHALLLEREEQQERLVDDRLCTAAWSAGSSRLQDR